MKWMVICFIAKWMLDTYDLVEIQQKIDADAAGPIKVEPFNPYKKLHIEDDGSFRTPAIEEAFARLAAKYHPKNANKSIPREKVVKRWENLNKAYATLTQEHLFEKYQIYGDPEGLMSVSMIEALWPAWLTDDDMKPMFYTWAFIGGVALLLFLSVA